MQINITIHAPELVNAIMALAEVLENQVTKPVDLSKSNGHIEEGELKAESVPETPSMSLVELRGQVNALIKNNTATNGR